MLRLNSVVLIASGVGLLTYSYGQPQADAVRQLEDVTRIATRIVLNYDRQVESGATLDTDAHTAGLTDDAVVGTRVANATRPPVSPWTTVVKSADIETPVVRAPDGRADKVRVDPATAPFVTAALPVRRPAVAAPDTSRDNAETGMARASSTLVRDIQNHLKRTNCYDGPVSGRWTPATQEAMEAFLAVANAALPVQKPDSVLLALVKSHTGTSCVPAWRTSVERTTHARAEPPAPTPNVYVTAAAEPVDAAKPQAAARSRPAGMMSVGAPRPAPVTVERNLDDERAAARRERSRAVALLVEPIDPDEDEAQVRGTRMIPPPIPRGDIDDDSDMRELRSKPRERSTSPTAASRLVTAALAEDDDAFDSTSRLSRPSASRQGQIRKQKRRAQARAKRNRADWQRRGPPSYAQYKPRRRTWLPRGSVRYQIHQAISGLY